MQVLFYRKNVILLLFVTVALTTAVVTMIQTPIYEASATIVIEKEPPPPGTVQNAQQLTVPSILSVSQEAAEVAKTQSEIVKSRVVIRKALEELKLTSGSEREIENKIAEFQKSVDVTPVKETTDLVRIRARYPSAQVAADMANAVAKAYVEWYIERKKGRASGTLAYLDKQLSSFNSRIRTCK